MHICVNTPESDRVTLFLFVCVGPDCAWRHCPTGDNPETATVNEANCSGVNGGAAGNLCLVECAAQGICDHVRAAKRPAQHNMTTGCAIPFRLVCTRTLNVAELVQTD